MLVDYYFVCVQYNVVNNHKNNKINIYHKVIELKTIKYFIQLNNIIVYSHLFQIRNKFYFIHVL